MNTLSILYSKTIHSKTKLLTWLCMFVVTFSISACGKSEEKLCIDKQSHLWDSKTNDKNANQAYWNAVAKCKNK
ncbi:hypothetical protein [Thiomicrorhabdus sp.]|uniref:hypothetical protein n=1 Tax=Thiomicrorhabdus sp. TaxID=2039724 RepID=UPI002AA875F0|nr:hypothetical protein [Thiomicrorhabdus sp.]